MSVLRKSGLSKGLHASAPSSPESTPVSGLPRSIPSIHKGLPVFRLFVRIGCLKQVLNRAFRDFGNLMPRVIFDLTASLLANVVKVRDLEAPTSTDSSSLSSGTLRFRSNGRESVLSFSKRRLHRQSRSGFVSSVGGYRPQVC